MNLKYISLTWLWNRRLEDCRIWTKTGVCHVLNWTGTWVTVLPHVSAYCDPFFTEPLFLFFQQPHSSVRDKTWQISKQLLFIEFSWYEWQYLLVVCSFLFDCVLKVFDCKCTTGVWNKQHSFWLLCCWCIVSLHWYRCLHTFSSAQA